MTASTDDMERPTRNGSSAPGLRDFEALTPDPRYRSVDTVDPAVALTIPASSRYLRLARLTAAGLAGDLGFPVEAVEDLRVAVDELCAALIDGVDDDTSLHLTYAEVDGGLEISGRCAAAGAAPITLDTVARELLNILADAYALETTGDERTFQLRKQPGS
jgi:serine/threonine-protein kinase RsbW